MDKKLEPYEKYESVRLTKDKQNVIINKIMVHKFVPVLVKRLKEATNSSKKVLLPDVDRKTLNSKLDLPPV